MLVHRLVNIHLVVTDLPGVWSPLRSDFVRTQYVTLGDEQVSEESACGQCQQEGRRRRHGRLSRRRSPRAVPPPPRDGPLIDGARYTAFVQLVGT